MTDFISLLKENRYPGRGIAIGKTADGTRAAIVYFIMGRSANSRNRIFCEEKGDVIIHPFDPSKVEDPSLIVYAPIRVLDNHLIVTNGDQTDTIYDGVKNGKTFQQALQTRAFEPDAPNYTPRISGMLDFADGDFSYQMSILKCADGCGIACDRFTFAFTALAGRGHFIHTYQHDGSPLPTFAGEPKCISVPDNIDAFANDVWNALDSENKISLYVRTVDLKTGDVQNKLFNRNV